ncbi:hypothetical protein GCM10029964_093650 [Kibdelosporangium lantanae]
MTESFGPRLRALRVERGISLSELARRIYYSKGHVSRIETGAQQPSVEFVRKCDAELDAGGALVALVSAASSAERAEPAHGEEEVWMMTMEPNGSASFTPVGRRQLLLGGTAILAGLRVSAAPPVTPLNAGDQMTHHRTLFEAARGLGQVAPPAAVLPMLVSQAQALRLLAKNADSRTSAEAAVLTARTAEFAGWMAQESGDVAAAVWWTTKAARVAAEAGDEHTGSYALVRRALIALYEDDGPTTIDLARQAQAGKRTPARILGLAAQREAQGHAIVGDYSACMRALDRAGHLLRDKNDLPPGPVIGTTHVSDPVAIVTGWCLYDLGRPAEAAEVLDREIARIPITAVRARARFGARQALAHAAAGELERACELAKPILDQVVTIGSATIHADVDKLAAMLRRRNTHPAVRALEPALSIALYSGFRN